MLAGIGRKREVALKKVCNCQQVVQAGYPVLWNERDSEYHWLILIFVKKERYISGVASGPKAVPMLPQAFQAIFVAVGVDFCMNLTGYGLWQHPIWTQSGC